jgi:hypothetical protein
MKLGIYHLPLLAWIRIETQTNYFPDSQGSSMIPPYMAKNGTKGCRGKARGPDVSGSGG